MRPPRSRLVLGSLFALGAMLIAAGYGPAAGGLKKGDPKAPAADPLPPVFAKDQPSSVADLKAIEQRVQELLPKITPAVVGIRIGFAQGSGVIVSKDGYVLTAGHVSGEPGRNVYTVPALPSEESTSRSPALSKARFTASSGLSRSIVRPCACDQP